MKIKICGLKFESNILDLSKLEPDYMGFIFWEKSKRHVKGSTPNLSETKIKKTGQKQYHERHLNLYQIKP